MLLRPERLSLPQLQRHCGPGGDGALNLHAAPMAALEVSGGSVGPLDAGGLGPATAPDAAVDRHLSGVGLYPTAGRELHPRGPPVGRHRPGQGPAQIGTLGTFPVDANPQPSPHVTNSIPSAPLRLSRSPPSRRHLRLSPQPTPAAIPHIRYPTV